MTNCRVCVKAIISTDVYPLLLPTLRAKRNEEKVWEIGRAHV